MRSLKFAGALLAALVLHAAATQIWPQFPRAADLFLVVLVLHAIDGHLAAGMLGGLAAGLVTDALTGGPFGLYGFVDTLLGYSSAFLAQRLVVRRVSSVLVLLALAAAVQQALLIGMAFLFVPGSALPAQPWPLIKVVSAGVLGMVVFQGRKMLSARYANWQRSRSARLR